jgi:predicted SAM-dependent methyltransferase
MGLYKSETQKIRPLINNHIQVADKIVDIGCGNDKLVAHALGIDTRSLPGIDLVIAPDDIYALETKLKAESYDLVYSSHCLEHLEFDKLAIRSWCRLLNHTGKLILYLPDERFYDNSKNKDHKQSYNLKSFMAKFDDILNFDYFMLDASREECYSFLVIARYKIYY